MPVNGKSAALLQAFLPLHAGSQAGAIDVHWSMLRSCDSAWTAALIRVIARPMPDRLSEIGSAERSTFQDEYFWQGTAAELLGCIGANTAVEPLIGVLADPNKLDIHEPVLRALTRLEPSFERAKQLLADPLRAPIGARIFGALGRRQAIPLLVSAIEHATDPVARAAMASELGGMPASSESSRALRWAFDQTPPALRMPSRDYARQILAFAAGMLDEPSLIPWLL